MVLITRVVEGESETLDSRGYGNSSVFDVDFKSVALFTVDIELTEFLRDLNRDDFFAAGCFDPDADDLPVGRCPAELFIDFTFDEKFIATEGIAVFKKCFHVERIGIREGFGFFIQKEFATKHDSDDSDADTDKEDRMGAGTCAASHDFSGVKTKTSCEDDD